MAHFSRVHATKSAKKSVVACSLNESFRACMSCFLVCFSCKVVTVGPILFSIGLNLYNKINLVDAPCPVCGVGLQGLKNTPNQCPRYTMRTDFEFQRNPVPAIYLTRL